MNEKKKGKGGTIAICVVAAFVALCFLGGVYTGIKKHAKEKQVPNVVETGETKASNLLANTTWIARDGSEAIFSEDRLEWYKDEGEHDDNYQNGAYKFYVGAEAVKYITDDLSDYGVTSAELAELFLRNEEYNADNFVVFDINFDKFVMGGEERSIENPRVPWFGFLLEDGTYLDVANMNTGTYYGFTKQ